MKNLIAENTKFSLPGRGGMTANLLSACQRVVMPHGGGTANAHGAWLSSSRHGNACDRHATATAADCSAGVQRLHLEFPPGQPSVLGPYIC